MSYRYYRLPTPRSYDPVRQTHKLSKTLSAPSKHLHQKKFDGSEPTMIFDFLGRYREACARLEVSEEEALLLLTDCVEAVRRPCTIASHARIAGRPAFIHGALP